MTPRPWGLVPPLFFSIVLSLATPAAGAEATLSVEVPAGTMKALRLKNIPPGAILSVDLRVDGPVGVAVVDSSDYRLFPAYTHPLFQSRIEKRIAFSVTAPAPGHYYVVLDNRRASRPTRVQLTVRATAAGKRGGKADPTVALLRKFTQKVKDLFIYKPFPIRVRKCGVPRALAKIVEGKSAVILCREYAQKLYVTLRDRKKAADALLFTLFHEVGHVLLAQWNYPFYNNEEVADEFAAALMRLLGEKDRLRAKAEFFAANPSVAEAIAKAFKDDRHPLSTQRARNILRWSKDPKFLAKWQTVFVPHMKTAVLERLRRNPTPWTNLALVNKELASRR